jgi:hypothetical protein
VTSFVSIVYLLSSLYPLLRDVENAYLPPNVLVTNKRLLTTVLILVIDDDDENNRY